MAGNMHQAVVVPEGYLAVTLNNYYPNTILLSGPIQYAYTRAFAWYTLFYRYDI